MYGMDEFGEDDLVRTCNTETAGSVRDLPYPEMARAREMSVTQQ